MFRSDGAVQASSACHKCYHVRFAGFRLFGAVRHRVFRETQAIAPDLIDRTTWVKTVTNTIVAQDSLCVALEQYTSSM